MAYPKIFGTAKLVADPELKFTQSGKSVAKVRVVHSYKRNGEYDNDASLFINLTCWGEQAEYMAENCTKGDWIEYCGSLGPNVWEDKNGSRHNDVEVKFAKAFKTGGNGKQSNQSQSSENYSHNQQNNDVWGSQPSQDFGSLDQPPF